MLFQDHQTPQSMGFHRQEYWSGIPFPFPGDLPNPEIEPVSPAWQVDSSSLSHLGSPLHTRDFAKLPTKETIVLHSFSLQNRLYNFLIFAHQTVINGSSV